MRAALLALALLAACAQPREDGGGAAPPAADTAPPPAASSPDPPSSEPPSSDVAAGDSATVARLEREARALARTTGCTSAGQCRTAPVGSRPCGGPREYVAWCPTSTDSAALYRKLDELERAEDAWNQARGMMSTCEFRQPPAPTFSGGRCGT